MEEAERAAELEKISTQSALPKIVVSGYSALNLIYYFTAGPMEVNYLSESILHLV
jgi:obg-like ATPase 1